MKMNHEEALNNTNESLKVVGEQIKDITQSIEMYKSKLGDLAIDIESLEDDRDSAESKLQDVYYKLEEAESFGNEELRVRLQDNINDIESDIDGLNDYIEGYEVEYEEYEELLGEMEQELVYLDEEYNGLLKDYHIYSSAIKRESGEKK